MNCLSFVPYPLFNGVNILKRNLDGLVRLSRFKEFLCFVMITTSLGAISSDGAFGWRLATVLLANWLAVAFAFMINDVEDAFEDAQNPAKANRNPVSCAAISARSARIASFGVALLAAVAFATLGFWPLVLGGLSLLIGFTYSWRPVRLKTIPFLDMASHGLMLAGLQFLTAYFTFQPGELSRWLFPFVTIVAISLYGELFNELRDLEEDRKAGLTHTAILLGRRATYALMMALLGVGAVSAVYTVFFVRLIPLWVLLLMAALAVALALRPLLKIRRQQTHLQLQQSFQKPLEVAAAASFAIHFIGVWMGARFL